MAVSHFIFTATHPITGVSRVLTPENEDVVFSRKKETSQQFYRHKIDTPLTFGGADFDWFYDIEQDSAARCEKIPVTVRHKTNTFIEGYFALNKGRFRPSRCKVELPVTVEDAQTCFLESLKAEKNVYEGTDAYDVKTFPGTLQTASCGNVFYPSGIFLSSPSSFVPTSCIPGGLNANWTLLEANFTGLSDDGSGVTYSGFVSGIWGRIVYNAGLSFEKPQVVLDFDNSDLTVDPSSGDTTYKLVWKLVGTEDGILPGARKLEDVANKLLEGCGLTVKSKFFSIDDFPDLGNEAYNKAALYLHSLYINQKSNIKRPDSSNFATRLSISMDDLLKQLQALFYVFPKVSGSNLLLEHGSYFKPPNTVILDLTASQYERWIKKKDEYEYEIDQFPEREKYSFQEPASQQFDGVDIIYPVACGGEEVTDIRADQSQTDILEMTKTPEAFSDLGMVVLSTQTIDGEAVVQKRDVGTGTAFLNGPLAWKNLEQDYHFFDKFNDTFTFNGAMETAETVRPVRKLQELQVARFGIANWLNFEPDTGKVKGLNGQLYEVENATFSAKTGSLTLELIY